MNYRDLIQQLKPMEGKILTSFNATWLPLSYMVPYCGRLVERVRHCRPGERDHPSETVYIQLEPPLLPDEKPGIKLKACLAADVHVAQVARTNHQRVRITTTSGDVATFQLAPATGRDRYPRIQPAGYPNTSPNTTNQPQTNQKTLTPRSEAA